MGKTYILIDSFVGWIDFPNIYMTISHHTCEMKYFLSAVHNRTRIKYRHFEKFMFLLCIRFLALTICWFFFTVLYI